jgi:hypothetical protein
LVDQDYWRKVVDWRALQEHGVVSAEDLGLLEFAHDGADAWAILKRTGIDAPPDASPVSNNLPLGGT